MRLSRVLLLISIGIPWLGINPALSAESPRVRQNQPQPDLPWESSYTEALAKAKAEKKPIFLMLTATWCGPCKSLESETLPTPAIRDALKDFVWVKAYEDKKLNEQFGLQGYPTLVFVDPQTEKPFFKTSGYEPTGPFLSKIIDARKKGGLKLSEDLQALAEKVFKPDLKMIQEMEKSGNAEGLVKYLEPVASDSLRQSDWLVIRLAKPDELSWSEVVLVADGDRTGEITPVLALPVQKGQRLPLLVQAPGHKQIRFPQNLVAEGQAVSMTEIRLEKLADSEKATLEGNVVDHQDQPVTNAIVRLCDWAITRTDRDGKYKIEGISPGVFTLRGESPGGENQEEFSFQPGERKNQTIKLDPVTTVGIRYAIQSKEGAKNLEGEGVKKGEAFFSINHSRFLLERGAETRIYWGSDFMMKNNLDGLKEHLSPEVLPKLEKAPPGSPFFWLFDGTSRNSGLRLEKRPYDEIKEIPASWEADDQAFQFLRGDLVTKGDVYLIRGCRRDTYAKMEITDITIVPASTSK
jgi:thiol-disulfide isomerase/thioredoxin